MEKFNDHLEWSFLLERQVPTKEHNMPITPQEAEQARLADTASDYEALDERLKNEAKNGERTCFVGSIPRDVVDRVINDWRAAGWKVELIPDQRDGDFIRLST
jgi:hypothetical protein